MSDFLALSLLDVLDVSSSPMLGTTHNGRGGGSTLCDISLTL